MAAFQPGITFSGRKRPDLRQGILMKILNRKAEMTAATIAWQGEGETVCLVPTMGSIHQGHLALIAAARKTASRVIVSIYVNPTQFGAGEDFDHYPRTLDADCAAITSAGGCDAIYVPADMYDDGHATSIVPAGVALAWKATQGHIFLPVLPQLF
jgi:pantoate--beta-alanine ligase